MKFYEATEEGRFLTAAIRCADALAKHIRQVPADLAPFSISEITKSPWPFRVNARTGVIISEYCSNVIEPIKLFGELLRIKHRIQLTLEQVTAYQRARRLAWNLLYSKSGPLKTFIWNGYFEDVLNDPERANRVQITPLETARYLIYHPQLDPALEINVPALIHWVSSVFATEGMDAIREQTWCYEPMGSHTARYASICALWYERTKDEWYKDQAFRFFNFATYMTHENGVVAVGPNWPGSWFSDGYGDYIRHFLEGLAAVPEWVPADRDHLLRSTSAIQSISYTPNRIKYTTFDSAATEIVRMTSRPKQVMCDLTMLKPARNLTTAGWNWKSLSKGGILYVRHDSGRNSTISRVH